MEVFTFIVYLAVQLNQNDTTQKIAPKLPFRGWEYLLLLIVFSGCIASQKTSVKRFPAFDKEGHRGCRGLMPENTIPAMLKAIDLGVTTIEMDALITKDKQVILSHDAYFNRDITTKPNGEYVTPQEEKSLVLYQMPYEEIVRYDVGLKPNPHFPQQQKVKAVKPLLLHVIDSVEAYCKARHIPPVFYNIETKTNPATDNQYHPEPKEFVDLLLAVVFGKKIEDRVIIQSFDIRTLQYIHQQYPTIKTSLLISGADKRTLAQQVSDLGFTPTIYSPAYQIVTKELIDQCHQQKMKVVPWTVNDLATIQQLKAIGVDGIITDYPNLFNE